MALNCNCEPLASCYWSSYLYKRLARSFAYTFIKLNSRRIPSTDTESQLDRTAASWRRPSKRIHNDKNQQQRQTTTHSSWDQGPFQNLHCGGLVTKNRSNMHFLTLNFHHRCPITSNFVRKEGKPLSWNNLEPPPLG